MFEERTEFKFGFAASHNSERFETRKLRFGIIEARERKARRNMK